MNCYQLSCGCWQSDLPGFGVGDMLSCIKCDRLKTRIVGFTTGILQVTSEAAA